MAVRTPVYLDHHATTPVDPAVIEIMKAALADHFGNPNSAHAFGWAAAALVDGARRQVAELLGCAPGEIVFTSGATEANNLALKGFAARYDRPGRIVTSNLEHESVSRPLAELAARGWEVVAVACARDGRVRLEDLAEAVTPGTALVSVVAAQNELGTLQPWPEIGDLCRRRGVVFHTDAAQAVGKVPLDVARDGIGLLSLSGHKIYGPKGVGALYVRARGPNVRLCALATGGGQERDLRSGTLNVPGIAGLGAACALAASRRSADAQRLRRLGRSLLDALRDAIPDVMLNGAAVERLPGSLNLTFPGAPAARLIAKLSVLAVSTGSACSSADGRPSPVLAAIGLDEAARAASLRICLGRDNTAEEVAFAAERIVAAVREVRGEGGAG